MKRLKNSMMVLVGFAAIVGLIALVTPIPGRGQGSGAAPARDVNVVNQATSPVLVRDVDSLRQPFQQEGQISVSQGSLGLQKSLFEVPEGKRAIIETVSVSFHVGGIDTPSNVSVITSLDDPKVLTSHAITVFRQGLTPSGEPTYAGTHYMRAYAGPGSNVVLVVNRSDNSEPLTGRITIAGYYVDVP